MQRIDHLFVITVALYGLCYILMYGSIFNKPRNYLMGKFGWFRNLITCPLCTGFWCGVALFPYHVPTPFYKNKMYALEHAPFIFPFACYSAIVCYICHLFTEILLAKAYPSIKESRTYREEEGIDDTDYNI